MIPSIPPSLILFNEGWNHNLSVIFKSSMDFMYTYANDMQNYIRRKCDDILDELIEKKEEYDSIDGDNEIDDDPYKQNLEYEIDVLELKLSDSAGHYCQVLFMSVFIGIYALFEKYLDDLCNDVCSSEKLSLTQNKLKEKGIRRSQLYLKNVAGLNFPDDKEEWKMILELSKLRNSFVHNAGKNYYRDNVHYILHDFFWIYDEFLEDLNEYVSVDFEPMLSLESIGKIIETLNRFSNFLDDILKDRYEKREMFKKGPSIKK